MLSDLRITILSSQLVAEEVWTDSPGRFKKSMDKYGQGRKMLSGARSYVRLGDFGHLSYV